MATVSAPSDTLTGLVFNIQRCSVHDGPGVRTTVFLKGCPLSCTWCHNPEGIDSAPVLMVNADRCLSCGGCVEACPVADGGAAPAGQPWDRDACTRCGACVEACPADARELVGREFEVTELVDVLERDRVFFEESGGGVTFSGGEPLSQPEFLNACLQECRKRGLHTAIDTCGLAPRENLLEVAELTDLVLYDIKHIDPEQHRRNTGVDNRLILDNLRALSTKGVKVFIRMPLIAGVNDGAADIEAVGTFVASLSNPRSIHLLPFHGLADGKLVRLEQVDAQKQFGAPASETLDEIADRLQHFDLDVTVGGRP